MRRNLIIGVLFALTILGVAWAQQTGPVAELRGRLNSAGELMMNIGSGEGVTLSSGRIPVLADINNPSATDDGNRAEVVGCVEHDIAGTSCQPVLVGGIASDAARTEVSADGDAVLAWFLQNGALATVLTAAGNLIAGDSSGLETQGGVAHDAADAGNPGSLGATAETAISGITAVADGDRTKLYAGIDGVLIQRPHANLEDRTSGVAAVTDGSSTSLIAAAGAGIRTCVTTVIVSNSSATNVTVDLRDGAAGSVIATIPAAANMGGAVIPLQVPLCTTANTALAVDPSAAASTVTTTAIGFKTKL